MLTKQQKQRIGIVLGILITIVGLIVYLPHEAQAQDGQSLVWGELTLGQVIGSDGALYQFEGNPGDTVTIQVGGISGFLPTVTLLDASRAIVSQDLNVGQTATVTLNFTLFSADAYYVQIGEVNSSVGQFTILLERSLPPGIPLAAGILTTGAVAPNLTSVIYDFETNPSSNTWVQVRSITDGYSPQVVIMDMTGDVVVDLSSTRLVAASLELGPSDETLKMVVSLGEFATQASYEIEFAYTAGGTPPVTSGPEATPEVGLCTITSARADGVNVRSGGSTNHPSVGILRTTDTATGIGFNSANGGWYQIRLADGQVGWVASFVVNADGECNALPITTYGTAPASTQEPDDGPVFTPQPDSGGSSGPSGTPEVTPDDDDDDD
ncbi:MAG: SH3 domain-containing protein [Anaerolineales bacterium]|nr:SH3 domain-containing protein [Anaerolineales bacterium]